MFFALLPNPHVITLPSMSDTEEFEYEILGSLDVANYKSGALCLRIHAGNADTTLALRAYKCWPDDATGARFQDIDQDPVLETATGSASGTMVTSPVGTLGTPSVRVVVAILATGAIASGESVTISAGIVLLTN